MATKKTRKMTASEAVGHLNDCFAERCRVRDDADRILRAALAQRDALLLAAEAALKRIQQGLDHRVAYVGDETLANQLRAAVKQAREA